MNKKSLLALLVPFLFLLVACSSSTDPLGMTGKTFEVENHRTNKDYHLVTIEEDENSPTGLYAVGRVHNRPDTDTQVIGISDDPDESGYHLVDWANRTYYAERIDDSIYFWFEHSTEELGSTEEGDYILKLIEE